MAGSPSVIDLPVTGSRTVEVLLLRGRDEQLHGLHHAPAGATVRIRALAGRDPVERVVHDPPEAILLDLGGDDDGLALLRRLREVSTVGIVTLGTGRPGETVRALDLGADDHLQPPVHQAELLARLRAVVRRTATGGEPLSYSRQGRRLTVDLVRHEVSRDGRQVGLTDTERRLLELLVAHPGVLLTHRELLHRVWGEQYGTESNYLRVYVAQLRRKLGDRARSPWLIETVPGVGYRWIGSRPARRLR